MIIKINRNNTTDIESAFQLLKEDKNNLQGIDRIKKALQYGLPDFIFNISITPVDKNLRDLYFIMSVFPEISTVDKIINDINNDNDLESIQRLWQVNKVWNIEIDERILISKPIDFNPRELTAMLLHEIGHIVCSTSIPSRVGLIVKYELLKSKLSNRSMLKDKIFKRILSIPILDACISDYNREGSNLKEEIQADSFAVKLGYRRDLITALKKVMVISKSNGSQSINNKIVNDVKLALDTVDDLQQRNIELSKSRLFGFIESTSSEYLKNITKEYIDSIYGDDNNENTLINEKKINHFLESADKIIEDGYYTEFFLFKKELKRIDPAEIDYIFSKINTIEDENDRMIIVAYIHHKMDLVDYYIAILDNPNLEKKYNIPHTLPQLAKIKNTLEEYRLKAMKQPLPDKTKGLLVSWPDGYEG